MTIQRLWHGRVGRLQYFFGIAIINFICILCLFIPLNCFLIYSFFLLFQIPLAIRRFHDFGYNAWNAIAIPIPIVNSLIWLMLVLTKGDAGKNKYGEPPPKEDLRAEISRSLTSEQYVQHFKPNYDIDDDAESPPN